MKLDGTNPFLYFKAGASTYMQIRMAFDDNGLYLFNNHDKSTTKTTVSSTVQKGEWFTVKLVYTANETSGYANVEMTIIAADGAVSTGVGVVNGDYTKTTMQIVGDGSNDGIVCLDDVTLERVKK